MPDDTGEISLKKKNTILKKIFNSSYDELSAEQKILMLVSKAQEDGVIEHSTKSMVENIFDFDDLEVSELMAHRKDIKAIDKKANLAVATKIFIETGYSRIPVYNEDIDNIVGFLYAKDLLKYVGVEFKEDIKVDSITREPFFVPRSKNCSELFAEMTANKMQMAIIVDEYGGTDGIITMEDLIESIVGNIQDEYDNEEEVLKKLSEKIYTVDGSASIDAVSELIEENLAIDDCETIAGLMLEQLGYVPKPGDRPTVTVGAIKLTAVRIEKRRIERILIEKL